jgi:hypothetical protein
MQTRQLTFSLILALALPLGLLPGAASESDGGDPAVVGAFLTPAIVEPTIGDVVTDEKCIEDEDGDLDCKPAAGGIALTRNGTLMYFNSLEATENVALSIVAEYGFVSVNDQSRVLDLGGDAPVWRTPDPVDGGADNGPGEYILPEVLVHDPDYNSGAFFCPGMVQLADGEILVVGGTDYYTEPATVDGMGVVELEGLKAARAFDPDAETWEQRGDMEYGRWYPGLITLGDNKLFITSGATKLMKPLYLDRPMDSGSNVRQTETYDPDTDEWTTNPSSADKTLPLYPRLHLLPNGHVFYNAAGQVFNPMGQSYDQALWNFTSAYNPRTQEWTDLGIPGLGTLNPGFRGSTFSVMLPLRTNPETGEYDRVELLSSGGILGVTPGTYVAGTTSLITELTIDGDEIAQDDRATGDLNNARWYSSGVLLPDGSVLALNGADRDEVVGPGTGFPVTQMELFDPIAEEWHEVAEQPQQRTYHNSALLLPDGRVMIGGHAPISTGYGSNMTLPGGFSENDGRNPSFDLYSPPYLFRGDRPEIVNKVGLENEEIRNYGGTSTVVTDSEIDEFVLVRNSAVTHIVDNDQRNVVLDAVEVSRNPAGNITYRVQAPPSGDIAPAGPYLLCANADRGEGLVPSVAAQVMISQAP